MEHALQELFQRNNRSRSQLKPYVLALLTSHMIGMEPGFSYLKRLEEENITIRISAEEEVFRRFAKTELVKATGNDDWIPHTHLSDNIIQDLDAVLIPILSFSIVSDILSFNEQRPFVRLIIAALLSGKEVFGLKIGADPYHPLWTLEGLDKGTVSLKRKLNEHLLELKSLGIKLIDAGNTSEFRMRKALQKTVVTDETIRYIHQKNLSKLAVMNGTIITPLARDTAKELNIALIME